MGLKKYIAKKLQNAIGINELKAEIDALHQRVEKKTDALACQTEKIEKKQAETTAKMQNFSGQTQDFSNQLQDFSSQVQDCNGQVRAFSNQVQTLQTSSSQKFDRVNTDNHNIIGKLSNTEKAYGELKRDVARLQQSSSPLYKCTQANFMQHLDYHIVHHCNLNCKCCSTFSPIASEKYASTEVFASDLKLLHDVVGDAVLQIHILGGEPLLHPDIEHFLPIARQTFPKARIDITTNGLLIKKMPPSFWDAMRENDIAVKYTRYPINLDYDEMTAYVKAQGVHAFSAGGQIAEFRKIPLNSDGTENARKSYFNCPYTDCPTLREGKLFRCPACAFSDVLNQKLAEEGSQNPPFQLTALDFIDLSTATRAEAFDFLSKAIPFCSYCKFNKAENIPWALSDHLLSEWIES